MKIYIAGPWAFKDEMPPVASQFEALGHTITHKWWEAENVEESLRDEDTLRHQAELDADGVKACELLVVLNTAKSEGKAVEQGIAIALDKPIIAVGLRGEVSKNVFHYMDNYYWVDNLNECLKVMRTLDWLLKKESNAR